MIKVKKGIPYLDIEDSRYLGGVTGEEPNNKQYTNYLDNFLGDGNPPQFKQEKLPSATIFE
jgi:hypothetical protein